MESKKTTKVYFLYSHLQYPNNSNNLIIPVDQQETLSAH